MGFQHVPGLYFGPSDIHGRGVFCAAELREGDIIEIAPVVPLTDIDESQFRGTSLFDYYFLWPNGRSVPALVLGYGMLYNHSPAPNVRFDLDITEYEAIFVAKRFIEAGTELLIDYHEGKPAQPVWFEVNS